MLQMKLMQKARGPERGQVGSGLPGQLWASQGKADGVASGEFLRV